MSFYSCSIFTTILYLFETAYKRGIQLDLSDLSKLILSYSITIFTPPLCQFKATQTRDAFSMQCFSLISHFSSSIKPTKILIFSKNKVLCRLLNKENLFKSI